MSSTSVQQPYLFTAIQALEAIQSSTLTIEAYAQSLLDRIAQRDEAVKAWAHLNPSQVLSQARELDAVPRDWRGPLHGLPVAIKDVIYTKDMPTQFNSTTYKDSFPTLDAASVMMLRKAGALIIGKTTTTEFAATTEGPKTSNAHAPNRTPGGSSSGSAAAVADFQVPLALATQTGGSVIRPASFNGVYGLKPTWNSISREGQKIYSLTFDTLGFFARSIEDLELLGSAFGLKDDEIPDEIEDGVRGLKFGFLKTMVWDGNAGPGTEKAFERGKEQLRDAGANVEDIDFPEEFAKLPDWHTCVLYDEGRIHFRPEYLANKDNLSPFLKELVENKSRYKHVDFLEAYDGIAALRPKWDAIAGKYDAIVTPSVPDVAPKGLESTGSAMFNTVWTALHVPVVNIPGFKGEDDMPVGLTLTAPRYRDMHLLGVANEVAKVWVKQ